MCREAKLHKQICSDILSLHDSKLRVSRFVSKFQEEKMKNYKKLKGIFTSAIFASIAVLCSQQAMAGSYTSSVNLPVLHSKGYVYTARVPVPASVRAGQVIKNVSWDWNVQGWPRGLQVQLCQAADRCVDVSRNRRASTRAFYGFLANQSFYYELKLSPSSPAPIAGQVGRITVDW